MQFARSSYLVILGTLLTVHPSMIVTGQPQGSAASLAQAKTLYEDGRYGEAISRLRQFIGGLRPNRDLELLAEAHIYLALSYLELNDRDAAKESIKELLRVDRNVEIDIDDYDPRLADLFQQAEAEVAMEPASTSRKSKLPWLLLGGGAAGAGAAVAVAGGGTEARDPLAVDNDGDGLSENQGDCDDTNFQVRPDGGFEFTIENFAFMGVVECSMKNQSQQVYRVTNNNCQPLTVRSLRVERARRVGPFGAFGSPIYTNPPGSGELALDPESSRIPAGGSSIIRRGLPVGGRRPLCCANIGNDCLPGMIDVNETYIVETSAGQQSIDHMFTVNDPDGRSCPVCGFPGPPDYGIKTDSSRSELHWASELLVPDGRGRIVLNQRQVIPIAAGRTEVSAQADVGENTVEAHVIASGGTGVWRFDFSNTEGFVPGSLRVINGERATVASHAIELELRGTPGPVVVFAFVAR